MEYIKVYADEGLEEVIKKSFVDSFKLLVNQNQFNTDKLLKFREKKILNDSGKISHERAVEKAETEYKNFRIKQDREYISSMDEMYKKYLERKEKK